MAGAARKLLLALVVIAVFGGTTLAAARVMDSEPDIAAIRAKRAQQNGVLERKERKREQRAARKAAAALAANPSRKRRWSARANRLCDGTYNDMLELVQNAPSATTQDALRLFDAALRISGRFIVRLERFGPAPNRELHGRLMRELKTGQAADIRAVQALKARWSQATLERWIQEGMQRSESVRMLAEQLDVVACAQLFDPMIY